MTGVLLYPYPKSLKSMQINDYNIDGRGPKSTGMANLVKRLKKDRVPIDGIGVQAHLIVGQLPTDIRQNLQDFADLGVDVAITELDIRMPTPPTKESLEQQKKDYETVIKACKAVKRCIGVTIWDWTDKVRNGHTLLGPQQIMIPLILLLVFLGPWSLHWRGRSLALG